MRGNSLKQILTVIGGKNTFGSMGTHHDVPYGNNGKIFSSACNKEETLDNQQRKKEKNSREEPKHSF